MFYMPSANLHRSFKRFSPHITSEPREWDGMGWDVFYPEIIPAMHIHMYDIPPEMTRLLRLMSCCLLKSLNYHLYIQGFVLLP